MQISEAQVLDKFIRGLKPKTRIQVELRDPQLTKPIAWLTASTALSMEQKELRSLLSARPTISSISQPRHMQQLGPTASQCKSTHFRPGP
jgi:hypothetical protein